MNKDNIQKKLSEVQELAEQDSYTLTRDDRDSIFYRTQHLKDHINSIYKQRCEK